MSKLSRFTQKIFGSAAGVNQIAKFGSLFAGAASYATTPQDAQSLSNWLTGWNGAAIGGNSPAIEDMNAAFFVLAYQLAYILQAGIPEYDAGTVYYAGSLVNVGGVIFICLVDGTTATPVTNATAWVRQGVSSLSVSTTVTVPLTADVVRADPTSGGFTMTLQKLADSVGQKVTFKNLANVGNTNVLIVAADGAELIDFANTLTIDPLSSYTLFNSGAGKWDVL